MENKLTIAIVALMVAALVAPGVMAADVEYSASVGSTANVVVYGTDSEFGTIAAGATYPKESSIILKNSGNAVGTVTAEFTTNVSGSYGMVSETDVVMPAEKLTIGGQALDNGGSPVTLTTVPAHDGTNDGTRSYDAVLTVPAGQASGTYTGNVQLTFGTATA